MEGREPLCSRGSEPLSPSFHRQTAASSLLADILQPPGSAAPSVGARPVAKHAGTGAGPCSNTKLPARRPGLCRPPAKTSSELPSAGLLAPALSLGVRPEQGSHTRPACSCVLSPSSFVGSPNPPKTLLQLKFHPVSTSQRTLVTQCQVRWPVCPDPSFPRQLKEHIRFSLLIKHSPNEKLILYDMTPRAEEIKANSELQQKSILTFFSLHISTVIPKPVCERHDCLCPIK